MYNNGSRFRGYITTGLAITFFFSFIMLVSAAHSYTQEEYLATHLSKRHESEVRKQKQGCPILSFVSQQDIFELQTDLRLSGTIMAGTEHAHALIVDVTTGKQKLYFVGESINGAKLIKIDKEIAVFEKDGRTDVLKVTVGDFDFTNVVPSEKLRDYEPLSIGGQEELPSFEPVVNVTDDQLDMNVSMEKLPPFVPVTNSTGPPIISEYRYKDLPKFKPKVNDSGPTAE